MEKNEEKKEEKKEELKIDDYLKKLAGVKPED